MKIKEKINQKWSLECKDDYEPIHQQLKFNNPHDTFGKRILFKGIVTSVVSIIFFCLLFSLTTKFDYKNNFDGSMGSAPGESVSPNPDGGDTSDEGNNYEGEESSKPSSPGEPGDNIQNNYYMFIEELKNCYFESSVVNEISYTTVDNTIQITLTNQLIEVINKLEFKETDTNISSTDFTHKVVINGDWCNIYFNESEYIALEYNNEYFVYETNVDNIYETIKENLK